MDDIRLQLINLNVPSEKIAIGVGIDNRHVSESIFDFFFDIKKAPPRIPFSCEKAISNPKFHGATYKSRQRRENEDFFQSIVMV